MNCSNDLKIFENSLPLASNSKSFSKSLEQFFLTVGQNILVAMIFFRSLEQFIQTAKGQIFVNRILFLIVPRGFSYLIK